MSASADRQLSNLIAAPAGSDPSYNESHRRSLLCHLLLYYLWHRRQPLEGQQAIRTLIVQDYSLTYHLS